MFAALPMYARPPHRAAHDALWSLIRNGLRARGQTAPDALDHAAVHNAGWGRPDLVLGHICNLPWRARHRGDTVIVGAADYGVDGEEPGLYHSHFVVRRDDRTATIAGLGSHRFALNEALSQSGWGAPQETAAAIGLHLRPTLITHAHRDSMAAVADGRADAAAIDAHVWQIETALGNPHIAALRILGHTVASPGISFVTAPGRDTGATFDAVSAAIAALPAPHRATLGLRGIVRLPDAAYDIPLPVPPVMEPDTAMEEHS